MFVLWLFLSRSLFEALVYLSFPVRARICTWQDDIKVIDNLCDVFGGLTIEDKHAVDRNDLYSRGFWTNALSSPPFVLSASCSRVPVRSSSPPHFTPPSLPSNFFDWYDPSTSCKSLPQPSFLSTKLSKCYPFRSFNL